MAVSIENLQFELVTERVKLHPTSNFGFVLLNRFYKITELLRTLLLIEYKHGCDVLDLPIFLRIIL